MASLGGLDFSGIVWQLGYKRKWSKKQSSNRQEEEATTVVQVDNQKRHTLLQPYSSGGKQGGKADSVSLIESAHHAAEEDLG